MNVMEFGGRGGWREMEVVGSFTEVRVKVK